jgi:hypothetical protein
MVGAPKSISPAPPRGPTVLLGHQLRYLPRGPPRSQIFSSGTYERKMFLSKKKSSPCVAKDLEM